MLGCQKLSGSRITSAAKATRQPCPRYAQSLSHSDGRMVQTSSAPQSVSTTQTARGLPTSKTQSTNKKPGKIQGSRAVSRSLFTIIRAIFLLKSGVQRRRDSTQIASQPLNHLSVIFLSPVLMITPQKIVWHSPALYNKTAPYHTMSTLIAAMVKRKSNNI